MTVEKVRSLAKERGISLSFICKKIGVAAPYFLDIEKSKREIPDDKLEQIAEVLFTTAEYLRGETDDPTREAMGYERYGLRPVEKKRFRMIGEIACGNPIYCNEDFETYIEASTDIAADFCLTAKGDSMINARIHDGDVVFIRAVSEVHNGEIAAVIINDEATLKRVYYYKDDNKLILSAENPKYAPLVYVNEELNGIRILGKAVAFMSNL